MSELFEITFFATKQNSDNFIHDSYHKALELKKAIIDSKKYSLFFNRDILVDVFEESDFVEYRLCIPDLVFTRKNYMVQLEKIGQVIRACFVLFDEIQFAVGIYEMTYYYLSGIHFYRELDHEILKNFPFLFFRLGNLMGFQRYSIIEKIAVIHNTNAQQIFANPITEYMEDNKADEMTAIRALGFPTKE